MIPIGPILDHYDIEYRDRQGNQKINCPSPDHEDRDPSASVRLDEDVWYCHGCGKGGSAIDLIMLREGVKAREAFAIAEGLVGPDDGQVRRGSSDLGGLLPRRSGDQSDRRRYVPPWLR